MKIRGLIAALNSNNKFPYKTPELVVDHLVIGAGVVGLAIAQKLCEKFPTKSTYVVERHGRVGEETSSRNSEVIHAGIYYPSDSLKTRLCIRGRDLMYQRCKSFDIPHRKTGKLVVAMADQRPYIEHLHHKFQLQRENQDADSFPAGAVPTMLISGDEARAMEPNLSPEIAAALWSPETGIVDSHSFMASLVREISESEAGDLAFATRVVRVDPSKEEPGWVVQTATGKSESSDAILARTVFNASGLSSPFILNSLLPPPQQIPMFYARGSYASYNGPGISGISRLIYPCPETGPNAHAFASLGTHLTLDMNGKVRFGPDLEFLSPPESDDMDFWTRHLVPNDSKLQEMHLAVTKYLPNVTLEGMQPDYVGIRPKLVGPGGNFHDFVFRTDFPSQFGGLEGDSPMISLLGFESPGLTSSLAIAEYAVDNVLENGGRQQRRS